MSSNRGRPALFDDPKTLTITIEQQIYEKLVAQSRNTRLPIFEHVRRAIDDYLVFQKGGSHETLGQ